jgi:DNA-binding Lrp family transcriptional regulator
VFKSLGPGIITGAADDDLSGITTFSQAGAQFGFGMQVEEIAKQTSLSTKTVTRRLQILRENHIIEFGIIRNMSSMQLEGYIEFGLIVHLQDDSLYQHVLNKICQEMQEYVFVIHHAIQKEFIFVVFFCPNMSTVDLILQRLESYEGVNGTETLITTKLVYYQDWVKREIDRKLKSEEQLAQKKDNFIELHS